MTPGRLSKPVWMAREKATDRALGGLQPDPLPDATLQLRPGQVRLLRKAMSVCRYHRELDGVRDIGSASNTARSAALAASLVLAGCTHLGPAHPAPRKAGREPARAGRWTASRCAEAVLGSPVASASAGAGNPPRTDRGSFAIVRYSRDVCC